MTDRATETNKPESEKQPPDIREKVAADTANSGKDDSTMTKVGRVANVLYEGALNAPRAAGHALKEDFGTWDGFKKTVSLVGESAVVGMALRFALPEAGPVAKIAGLGMGAWFAKDPLIEGYNAGSAVWNDSSQKAFNNAAQKLGAGLGEFAVDGAIGMVAAGGAAKLTPKVGEALAPTSWNRWESFKSKHMGGTVPLMADAAAVTGTTLDGKPLVNAEAPANAKGDSTATTDSSTKKASDLTPEQVRALTEQEAAHLISQQRSHGLYRNGIVDTTGKGHGLDETVRLLEQGIDPETVKADASDKRLKSLQGVNVAESQLLIGDAAKPVIEIARKLPTDVSDVQIPTRVMPEGLMRARDVHAEKSDLGRGENTNWGAVVNADTMGAQGRVMKRTMDAVSDKEAAVTDGINRTFGAVDVRTNPAVKRLAGYEGPRDAMLNLAQEVNANPALWMRVGDLFTRFGDAAVQSGSEATDVGRHARNVNTMLAEDFETTRQNIIDAGVDPDVALRRKIVPPLLEITSDAAEGGHEGPHTVRGIYGPNDEPVWPIDLIKSPVRELGTRATDTPGKIEHEGGHDQYGNTGKFDPATREAEIPAAAQRAIDKAQTQDQFGRIGQFDNAGRDNALSAAADKALKDDVNAPRIDLNKPIELPTGGMDPQEVLLNNVARKAEKIDPAEREDFIYKSVSPQRFMNGVIASDQLLGPAGRMDVTLPNQGTFSLNEFLVNVALGADPRTPSQVLADAQGRFHGKGDRPGIDALIRDGIDKILGPNANAQVPAADGSKITLRDAALKVSDATRNIKFDTYDKPLPASITMKDVLVGLAKGWADETFADWAAGSRSGQSAAPYFQALRKDGKLSKGTVMGQELRSDENPLGVEVHPVDKVRPRFIAGLIRALAQPHGKYTEPDKMLLDYADALDKYSRDAGQPGPITLANMDAPGKTIEIPEALFDKFIPELVNAQLNTPLPRLKRSDGTLATLFDILPDLRKNMRKYMEISDQWVDAIKAGQKPEDVKFDAANAKQGNIFRAGQIAFFKLVAGGMDEMEANNAVNAFSDNFSDRLHAARAAEKATPSAVRLRLAPGQHAPMDGQVPGGLAASGDGLAGRVAAGADAIANGADDPARPGLLWRTLTWPGRRMQDVWNLSGRYAPAIGGVSAAHTIQDLQGLNDLQKKMLENWDSNSQGQ
jgi:hypothetical protein